VCDGQQRLTTLFLLLAAVKSVALEMQQTKIVEMVNLMLFTDLKIERNLMNLKEGEYF